MASTIYLINVRLEFDTKEARDKKYSSIKTDLSGGKATDTWAKGTITKDEYVVTDISSETV